MGNDADIANMDDSVLPTSIEDEDISGNVSEPHVLVK
jgi:hypothetical protein